MKVLFAVSSERISETIIKKYQKEYKEILSYKNVYYFNAILKEIQKDKSYDRIVISEDLEPFSTNNYDSIDKFIFEKLDDISDEAEDIDGNETSIILICTDRHTKGSEFLVKLFGIGIYNALLGDDRSMENVCKLIKKPRLKKEAKAYYKIDSDDVNYSNKSDKEVNEVEIQNILNHFKRLGRNTSKYSESFASIASQYTDDQLKIIINCLPINVKAVLEGESPKYQELMSVNGVLPKTLVSESKEKNDKARTGLSIDILENKNQQMSGPVVIPSTVRNTKNPAKSIGKKIVNNVEIPTIKTNENKVRKVVKKREEPSVVEVSTRKPKSNAEKLISKREMVNSEDRIVKKKIRPNLIDDTPKKVDVTDTDANDDVDSNNDEDRKGRGRPKKAPAPLPFKDNSKKTKKAVEEDDDTEDDVFLPGMMDEEENDTVVQNEVPSEDNYEEDYDDSFEDNSFEDDYSQDENEVLPGLDDEETNNEDYDDDYDDTGDTELPGINDEEEYEEYEDEDTEDVLPGLEDEDNSENIDDEFEYVEEDDDDVQEEIEYADDAEDDDIEYIDEDDDTEYVEEDIDDDEDTMLPGMDDDYTDEVELPGLDDLDEDEQTYSTEIDNTEEDDDLLSTFDDDSDDGYNTASSNSNQIESIKPKVDYSMSSLNSLMTKDKKIVTFLGTTKNGTSFLVNNLAALFSTCGINTAILDMTKNKNSYYIYTNNEEDF